MVNYSVLVFKQSWPLDGRYWDFLRKYDGWASSEPQINDPRSGETYTAFISSSEPITQKSLQEEFPELEISDLELSV